MGEERFDFENLKVYQKALDYVDFVYENTKHFPKTEIFDLLFDRSVQKGFDIDMFEYCRRQWRE